MGSQSERKKEIYTRLTISTLSKFQPLHPCHEGSNIYEQLKEIWFYTRWQALCQGLKEVLG
jgi:hypothetical protein